MDLYRVGIALTLTNGVSSGLSVIAADLLGVHHQAGEVEKGFSKWGLALGGAAAVLMGGAMLGGLSKLVEKGSELTHQTQLMAAAGFTAREQADAMAKAWQLSAKYRSMGVGTITEIIRETTQPYGSAREAINMAELATRASVVLNAILPDHQGGEQAVQQMFAGVKAAELRNIALDPRKMENFFDSMVRVAEATGGKVMPRDYFQFTKYSRANAPYLSEDFLSGVAPLLIQELGASGAGNAITTLNQALVGGKMSKRAAAEFIRLGLVSPGDVLKTSTTGTQVKPGGVHGFQLAEHDPYQWAQKVLMPAMIAHGITDPEQQRLEFASLFSARLGETAANILATQLVRVEKDRALKDRTRGLGAVDDLLKGDFQTGLKAFREQRHNLLMAVGQPLVGPAVDLMNGLTGAMSRMADFAKGHPGLVRFLGEAAAALAAALVVGGTIAVGAAIVMAIPLMGTVGLWVAAATALAAGLGTLFAINWSRIDDWTYRFHLWVSDVFTFHPAPPRREQSRRGAPAGRQGAPPPPAANPRTHVLERAIAYELIGKWIDRAVAFRHAVGIISRYWGALQDGLNVHLARWGQFEVGLLGAFGRITGRISAFLTNLSTLPGRLLVEGFRNLFPRGANAPAAAGAAAPKAPPKPGVLSGFRLPTTAEVRAFVAGLPLDPSKSADAAVDRVGRGPLTRPELAVAAPFRPNPKLPSQSHTFGRHIAPSAKEKNAPAVMMVETARNAHRGPGPALATKPSAATPPIAVQVVTAAARTPAVPQAHHTHLQVHTHVNLDGHKVAENVTRHQAKHFRRPAHGTSSYDPNMAPMQVGGHYSP